ncbi:hypothetical protein CXG81DRAFT_18529 [Caulochytrium protostelioides]|uniref:Pali-domain-containing protein n=1 Tax=Caulochytrium protostelioides TaxID=1555241 RepID=A0A4P9WSU5_9FUNG|nr:hypothetical protein CAUPRSCDRAFT_12823 [Caulochytrium protostelioides]RKP01709.1 hypothetical protein CXG81DRAFT_18529 [Caulochytrium protostelioides]|eukprot:RKP01709.1 hypothetical protein CXG81DRAFT_18529 [Caulochytrium protostelioides]
MRRRLPESLPEYLFHVSFLLGVVALCTPYWVVIKSTPCGPDLPKCHTDYLGLWQYCVRGAIPSTDAAAIGCGMPQWSNTMIGARVTLLVSTALGMGAIFVHSRLKYDWILGTICVLLHGILALACLLTWHFGYRNFVQHGVSSGTYTAWGWSLWLLVPVVVLDLAIMPVVAFFAADDDYIAKGIAFRQSAQVGKMKKSGSNMQLLGA